MEIDRDGKMLAVLDASEPELHGAGAYDDRFRLDGGSQVLLYSCGHACMSPVFGTRCCACWAEWLRVAPVNPKEDNLCPTCLMRHLGGG